MASTRDASLKPKTAEEPIKTGIEPKNRPKIADVLNAALGDSYVLLVKSHGYHWNVVGPIFKPLHELTEAHYDDLFAAVDEIAERIRSIGEPAPSSFAAMLEASCLKEETGTKSAAEMVAQLVKDHEAVARRMREGAGVADDGDDLVTVDLFTRRLAFHEKAIWMLRATVAE